MDDQLQQVKTKNFGFAYQGGVGLAGSVEAEGHRDVRWAPAKQKFDRYPFGTWKLSVGSERLKAKQLAKA